MTPDSPKGTESEARQVSWTTYLRCCEALDQARTSAATWQMRAESAESEAERLEEVVRDKDGMIGGWKLAANNDRLQKLEALAEVSRLREQLAAQTEQVERTRRAERRSIASVLTGMLEELEAAYVGEFGEGPAPSRNKLREVQKFSIDLFATSGPVELDEFESGVSSSEVEAPQPQEMTQHKVNVVVAKWDPLIAFATCRECLEKISGDAPFVRDWADKHEADTLRPVLDELSRQSQEFEGRPSGSERLAPRPVATMALVREFHEAFGLPINDATRTLNKLRADLIREEAREAADAIEGDGPEAWAKELADLVIVAYGAALTLGIDLDRAVILVHASNMSKLGADGRPVMREDGKVLKGPNYLPPDMSSAVDPDAAQAARSEATPEVDPDAFGAAGYLLSPPTSRRTRATAASTNHDLT